MSGENRNRGIRLGLAAIASGLGYAFHALSQDRSIRSKIREDAGKIKQNLASDDSEEATVKRINHRINAYKASSDLLNCPFAQDVTTESYLGGEVQWINFHQLKMTNHVLVYFHGGQRLEPMQPEEWRFVHRLGKEQSLPIAIIPIQPLFVRSFEREIEQTYSLFKNIQQRYSGKEWISLSYDSGALLALNLAEVAPQLFNRMIILSAWFGLPSSQLTISENDYYTRLTENQLISELWQEKNDVIPIDHIQIADMPLVVFIGGSYDSLRNGMMQLYKRLRAHNKPTRYYQFDRMVHDFALRSLPEADEAIDIIYQEIKNVIET